MRCPFCGQDNDKVIDSRASDEGRAIRRRRQCLACQKRFTTYETVEENALPTVIKKDGTRVPFDRNRIIGGIEKACYKRPISAQQITAMTDEVVEEICRRGEREVPSLDIGKAVADRLKRVDQVAYVRFASVYKQFRDIDDLLDEVKDLLQNPPQDSLGQGKLF